MSVQLFAYEMSEKDSPFCQCLLFSANALSRNITRLAEEEFARVGLAPSYGFLLLTINGQPGIQPRDLSKIMMLTPSTVTRLVEKMENKGLVRREYSGKNTFIYPTDRLGLLEPDIRTAWRRVHERYSEILGLERGISVTREVFQAAKDLEMEE